MKLNALKPGEGSKHASKHVGRGIGSGLGKTCGRGHKGQKSRAGGFHKVGPRAIYRLQTRGGKGIITMKANERTGPVIGALTVRDSDEIMLITAAGQMVRTFVKDIRETGRNTQGVKLIELDETDHLQAIAPVISEENEEAAENASNPSSPEAPPDTGSLAGLNDQPPEKPK